MPEKRAATLKDIAREAGVGLVTASTVVNATCSGRYVAQATRQRVLEVAERLHYSPNVMARGLKRVRLDSIGVTFASLPPDDVLTEPYSVGILRGIVSGAHPEGFNVTLFHKAWRDARRSASGFRGQGIDGFVIAAPPSHSDMVSGLSALGIPLVVLSAVSDEPGVPAVAVDNARGVRLAVEHLLSLGHRKIAHLLDEVDRYDTRVRRDSFLETTAEAGVAVPPEYLLAGGGVCDPAIYRSLARRLLTLPDRPTAIFAAIDWIALQVLDEARALGIRVPEELSIVGFDDVMAASMTTPPLTTVRQPLVEMGREAARLLMALVDDKPVSEGTHWFEPELIARGSTAKP
jgi:LacI family transcriptional regulator